MSFSLPMTHLEKSSILPSQVRKVRLAQNALDAVSKNPNLLGKYGIALDGQSINKMMAFRNYLAEQIGQDAALTPTITTPSSTTPVQYLQSWLTGFVEDVTAVRRIDEFLGIVTQGDWADEEVVQPILERTGEVSTYTDYGNTQQSAYNVNFERRTIVRFESGLSVGKLEEARAARIRVNTADAKRSSSSRELEIQRNSVGFFGYNNGLNRTYGFLNEPALSGYVTVATGGGGGTEWSSKTFLEIVNDLLTAASLLRTSTREIVDSQRAPIILGLPTAAIDFLQQTTDFGVSVYEWLKKNYPNWTVISAPELDGANGGENVFYLYAESVEESGSDDQRTWVQAVPTKFTVLGVDQKTKSYEEAHSNATAGAFLKRPYAVVRFTGI